MTNLFDNYEKYNTTIPDNRYEFLPIVPEYKDVIIRGAEVEHCFKIPHKMEDIIGARVIYYQGIEEKLIIPFSRIQLRNEYSSLDTTEDASDKYCWAYYNVMEDESLLFNTYNKQVQVQLVVVVLENGEQKVEYSNIYKIKVLPTLFTFEDGE